MKHLIIQVIKFYVFLCFKQSFYKSNLIPCAKGSCAV